MQGTQQGGGPAPGKMAAPSVPVTLGPPGGKPAVPAPPAKRPDPALDVDLGESGNETVQEEPGHRDFERSLQDTKQHDVALGWAGDEGIEPAATASSVGHVDLGESGNTTSLDELLPAPAYGRAPVIDLGAPGDATQQRQRQLARDTAATVELGAPGGYGPLDDVHSVMAAASEDESHDGAVQGIEIVDLSEGAHADMGVALVEDEPELPAPVAHAEPEFLNLPPPQEGRAAQRTRGPGADRSVPGRPDRQVSADLPAPAQRSSSAPDLPAPARRQAGAADLPAPAQRSASAPDLPAPARRQAGAADLPAPAKRSSTTDLPAPAQRSAGAADLPAPARRQAGAPELPVPAAKSSQSSASRAELPQPAKGARPAAASDLPAPKGFFDDLEPADTARPAPSSDLPAPKGFFDDLPEPADTARPGPSSDLPAPKGFFDDLLEPADTARDTAGDLPTTRGFDLGSPGNALDLGSPGNALDLGSPGAFDDLEIAQGSTTTEAGSDLFGASGGDFNPLGGPAIDVDRSSAPRPGAIGLSADDDPFGFGSPNGLALADPDEVQPPAQNDQPFALNGLDLEAPRGEDGLDMEPLALDRSGAVAAPIAAAGKAQRAVETAKPATPAAASDIDQIGLGGSDVDDFGLPSPTVPGMPDVTESPRKNTPAAKAPARPTAKAVPKPGLAAAAGAGSADGEEFGGLELPAIEVAADAPARPAAQTKAAAKAEKPATKARGRSLGKKEEEEVPLGIEQTAVPRVVHGHLAGSTLTERHLARRRQQRKRIIIAAASVVVLLVAGGGFFAYQRWDAERTRKANIQAAVNAAVAHLREGDPGHWDRAFAAANKVLEMVPNHPDGLGIGGEAAFAALLDEGLRIEEWRKHGTELTGRMDKALVQGEHVDKAQALKSLEQGRPDGAITRLQGVLGKAPNDPDALLYLGWALAASHKPKEAAGHFQGALAAAPARPVPALYGLARAQLAQGDRKAARATFEQILAKSSNHFGALVGVAESTEDITADKREALYLEIVKREDASQADPRALSRAWVLAGWLALQAGRPEVARPRFENALKAHPINPSAQVGLARVALLQDRLDAALEALTAVLGTDPKSMDVVHQTDAVLARAELALRRNKPDDDPTVYLERIFDSEKSIADVQAVASAYVLRGTMLSSDEAKREEAITAYKRALELAGADALEPALKLAELYTVLGRMDDARAVLEPIEHRAASDAAAAVALGAGYKRANALNDAETWLRKALELKPKDIDAQFQLGQVMAGKKQYDEAIQVLTEAAQAAPDRPEIGLRLAVVFEELGRVDEAAAAYERLLADKTPSVELMARAGRFFVRQGKMDRAGELGDRILAVKDTDAAGHFLRGEAMYRRGEYAEARTSFRRAADIEPDPEYLEANGRASEQLELYDEAFEAYSAAARDNDKYLAPQLGRIRLLLLRRDVPRALEELTKLREIAPRNAAVYHYLGESYRQQEEHDKAASYYRQALEYEGNRADTHYGLGKSYLELSKERDAARALDQATSLARRQNPLPKWLEDGYYELGYVQRSQSKRREAIQAWKSYLELIPKEREKDRKVVEVKRLLMSLEAQTR